jgi:hypothetical protein
MLRLQNHSIIIFILNALKGCFMHIPISSMRIQNIAGATYGTFLCSSGQTKSKVDSYWLIFSWAHFSLL